MGPWGLRSSALLLLSRAGNKPLGGRNHSQHLANVETRTKSVVTEVFMIRIWVFEMTHGIPKQR
jgi:hypothetical protein